MFEDRQEWTAWIHLTGPGSLKPILKTKPTTTTQQGFKASFKHHFPKPCTYIKKQQENRDVFFSLTNSC